MSALNTPLLHLLARFDAVRFADRSEEEGAAMAEYGLLLALVAVVAIVTLKTVGTNVATKFTAVASNLS